MKVNQKGLSVVEVLVVIVIVGLLGAVGWLVYDRQKSKISEQPATLSSDQQKEETPKQETKADPNEGYLVVKEWGLRFKAPTNLTDVKYHIFGDTVAFYAKPAGSSVEYRSDYEKLGNNNNPQYAVGQLYRSSESTKEVIGTPREGKKIGNYYYYTAHAFSSLATGAGCVELYGDNNCEAEAKVFQSVNQGDTALLNTIELAQ